LFLYWRLAQVRQEALQSFVGAMQAPNLALVRTKKGQAARAGLLALSWMVACLAVMQPAWHRSPHISREGESQSTSSEKNVEVIRSPHDVIFVLDTSASMTVADTRSGQTRLDAGRGLISDVVARLTSENVGLSAFTSALKSVVPPTLDHLYLLMLLQDVVVNDPGVSGTDFRKMLSGLQKSYWDKPSERLVSVVVISDGGDTLLQDLSPADQQAYIHTVLKELKDVNAANRRIYTVGMGATQPSPIPGIEERGRPVQSSLREDILTELATAGQGTYYQANSYEASELNDLLATAILDNVPKPFQAGGSLAQRLSVQATHQPPLPVFPLFSLLAFGLLVAALLVPEVEDSKSSGKGKRAVT
jgi:Ca-activated chloride channel family protein